MAAKSLFLSALIWSGFAFGLGRDVTAAFLLERPWGDTELRRNLDGHRVLFVPGILSDAPFQSFETHPWLIQGAAPFTDQMRWLRQLGVDVRRVPIQTESPAETNARVIVKEIAQSEKPVILVTHSKGGIDTLEALLFHPEVRGRVRGWIPIQAPFRGSPVADYINTHQPLRGAFYWALKGLGGDRDSLVRLTTPLAEAYLARHAAEIETLAGELTILSVGTWKRDSDGWSTPLEWTRAWMERNGQPNDGLVPAASALFPHDDHVRLPGIDHAGPVSTWRLRPYDRIALLRSLLTWVKGVNRL